MDKYVFVAEEIWHGKLMRQIMAMKDFVCQGVEIHKGDLGGWIEGPQCLSQDDNSWVADPANVFGPMVPGNALVCSDGWAQEHGIRREAMTPYFYSGWSYIV